MEQADSMYKYVHVVHEVRMYTYYSSRGDANNSHSTANNSHNTANNIHNTANSTIDRVHSTDTKDWTAVKASCETFFFNMPFATQDYHVYTSTSIKYE